MNAARKTQTDIRGKVMLRMSGGSASPLVLEVATRVARTFRGELRGLFIENEELLALAGLPFAREISLAGRRSRSLSLDVVRQEMAAASAAMEREFERLKQRARISAYFEVIQGAAEDALQRAMRDTGILAIGEPVTLATPDVFAKLFQDLTGLSGVVVVGCEARRAKGPVLSVIDPACDVALLVDTAEKIAGEGDEQVVIIVAAGDNAEAERLESEARTAIDAGTRYRFERIVAITPRSLAALVAGDQGGLVIARAGGPVAEDGGGASRFACAIDCPLFLLR